MLETALSIANLIAREYCLAVSVSVDYPCLLDKEMLG